MRFDKGRNSLDFELISLCREIWIPDLEGIYREMSLSTWKESDSGGLPCAESMKHFCQDVERQMEATIR